MWRISGTDSEGRPREVRFTELGTANRPGMHALFRDAMHGETSEAFEVEMQSPDPLPGVDGIEAWGATAAQLFGPDGAHDLAYVPNLAVAEGGQAVPGLLLNDVFGTASFAFHAPEAVVADVSGMREVEISADHPTTGPAVPPYTLSGAVLESRVYTDGAVIESETESETQSPSFRVALPGNRAGLIARVATWISRPFASAGDPFMFKRLQYFEQRYPGIASLYPDISLAMTSRGIFRAIPQAPASTAVIVFVHGTYSCSVPNLALLYPLKIPAYRFEHDTFVPVGQNKELLVKAIRDFIPRGARIYLVAHSRGGLVSRLAARDLLGPYEMHVLTYGTPHRGTPLANAGKRMFSTLLAAGRTVLSAGGGAAAGAVFGWDPASLAGKLLLKGILPKAFPAGLDDMRPQSGLISALVGADEPFPMRTWGAKCDADNLPSGAFTFTLREAIKGAFGGAANDTVVGTASARGAGMPQKPLDQCTHFEYFARREVRDEIQSLT